MNLIQVLLILYVSYHHCASAYKFLAVLPTPSMSHYSIGQSLMQGLANEGHSVTVISPYKEENATPNYQSVYLDGALEKCLKSKYRTI